MSTTTTRLGLTKPSKTPGSADPVDVDQLNTNSDVLDYWTGCLQVNDAVVPATTDPKPIYKGAIVRENTSKNVWVANVSGSSVTRTFIYFPYCYFARTAATPVATTVAYAYTNWGWTTFDANYSSPANASTAEKQAVTNFWVCPLEGIYSITVHQQWSPIATASKFASGLLYINSNTDGNNALDTQVTVPIQNSATFGTNVYLHQTRRLSQNDVVGAQLWQDTGGNLDVATTVEIVCVTPL